MRYEINAMISIENHSTAKFQCREGLTLVGDQEWQCQERTWGQGVLPACVGEIRHEISSHHVMTQPHCRNELQHSSFPPGWPGPCLG